MEIPTDTATPDRIRDACDHLDAVIMDLMLTSDEPGLDPAIAGMLRDARESLRTVQGILGGEISGYDDDEHHRSRIAEFNAMAADADAAAAALERARKARLHGRR